MNTGQVAKPGAAPAPLNGRDRASRAGGASASSLDVAPGERDKMLELLDGHAVVVLELAHRSSLSVPVTVTSREEWHRPSCD
jgi:hypothetical protein